MSATLLDINVLMALAWDTHPQFKAAERWFVSQRGRWASCPLTQLGFVRLSANPKIVSHAGNPRLANEALDKLLAAPRHEFWPDSLDLADEPRYAKLQGHNQFTDAYLLALAQRHKGRLATFDQAVASLAREFLGSDAHVVILAP